MNYKTILLSVLFIFSTSLIYAQVEEEAPEEEVVEEAIEGPVGIANTKKKLTFGMFTTISLNTPFLEAGDMNTELSKYSYPDMEFRPVIAEIGLHWYFNQYIINFEWGADKLVQEESTYILETTFNSIRADFGYDLIKNKTFALYPYLGYSYNLFNYSYNEVIPQNTTFPNYMTSSLDYKDLTNKKHNLTFGLGLTYYRNILYKIKAGYNLNLVDKGWTIRNNSTALVNAPGIQHPYFIAFSVGLGNINH